MSINLTERQIAVLRYFRDYRKDHGIAPTLEEAATEFGVSKITVHEHLNHLQKKGAVLRDKAKARSVAILYDPDAERATRAHNGLSISVLGRIAAGQPIEAIEDREELLLTELVPSDPNHYMLRVSGESMIEDHIQDGDLVLVERSRTARNGEIVVAIVDGENATLKRFYKQGSKIRLQPANSQLEPIYPKQIEIRGIVRGVVRHY